MSNKHRRKVFTSRTRGPRFESLEDRRLPATYVVNSLADILKPPVGTITLRSAIEAADASAASGVGNVIDLSVAGAYKITLTGTAIDNTAGEFAITGPTGYALTIANTSGGGVVIDGGGKNAVFSINPAGGLTSTQAPSVTISDVTITDGNDATFSQVHSGGGIGAFGDASLTLQNVDVTDNQAEDGGGGVYVNSGKLTVTNGSFSGNSAYEGGAIYAQGSVTINRASFKDNTANGGGAIFLASGTTAAIAGSQFIGNAAGDGGAVYIFGTNTNVSVLNLSFDTFSQNRTDLEDLDYELQSLGGAIDASSAAVGLTGENLAVTAANCLFLGNFSFGYTDGGGAIEIENGAGSLTVLNSQFSGNTTATVGGAVDFEGSSVTIRGTTVDHSTGDGLYLGGVLAVLSDDTIADNVGAGTYVLFGVSASFLADTIDGNSGSGILVGALTSATVTDSIVAQDAAPDVSGKGAVTDGGGNLIGDETGGPAFVRSTLVGTAAKPINPQLGPLIDDGSVAPFVPVGGSSYGAGSPATFRVVPVQAIAPTSPASAAGQGNVPMVDERGFPTPATPSIGAYQPQFARAATPAQVYVENLYEVLLDRHASASEVAGWVPFVNSSGSNAATVQVFTSSAEYRTDQISLFYEEDLGRATDTAGLQHWLGVLAAGGTLAKVQAGIIASPEFFGDHGSNADTFTEAIYEDVLNRLPTTGEVDGWYGSLLSGTLPSTEALDFILSAEDETDLVQADYSGLLGRSASSAEVAAWLKALTGSADPQTVLVDVILGSPESYADRA